VIKVVKAIGVTDVTSSLGHRCVATVCEGSGFPTDECVAFFAEHWPMRLTPFDRHYDSA